MEKITSFGEVLTYLKDQEIVMTGNHTSFYLKDNQIVVHGKGTRYILSLEDFKRLYGQETFYLYKPDNSSIDNEKDEEYYSWKATGIN